MQITELDPDAPIRQNRRLDREDESREQQLLRDVWQLIRAGQLEQAKELCRKCNQHWRAASLSGGALIDIRAANSQKDLWTVQGNSARALWRDCCRHLSRAADDAAVSSYEKAIYGALSDNLEAVFEVCASWHDHLWACLNGATQARLEQVLAVESFGKEAPRSMVNAPLAPDTSRLLLRFPTVDAALGMSERTNQRTTPALLADTQRR